MKAVMFLLRCDHQRYGDLLKRLEDDDIFGTDNYPVTVAEVFSLLNREAINLSRRNLASTNQSRRNRNRSGNQNNEENANVMFAQWQMLESRGLSYGDAMADSFQFVQEVVDKEAWVLLDTGSTCSSTNLLAVLKNIKEDKGTNVLTNDGCRTFSQKGTFTLFPVDMFYNKDSLDTVLSFYKLQSVPGVHIHYDSDVENVFHVEYKKASYEFICRGGGLYYYVMAPANNNKTKSTVDQYSLYSTVKNNKEYFTANEIKLADKARNTMRSIGWPSVGSYKYYVSNNLLRNPSFTVYEINRAEKIYGLVIPILQSKMTLPTPPVPQLHKRVPLPLIVSKEHSEVDIALDFFWIHGIIFFHTKSKKLNFRTASCVSSRSFAQIWQKSRTSLQCLQVPWF